MLKDYLSAKNIAFENVFVDQEPNQMQNFVDTCGSMRVPCTHIIKDDGTEIKILGFDKEKINQALGII